MMNTSKFNRVVSGLVENNPDVFVLKKDWDELILIMKGDTPEYLEEERDLLLEQIKRAGEKDPLSTYHRCGRSQKTDCRYLPVVCRGSGEYSELQPMRIKPDRIRLLTRRNCLRWTRSAVENYLRCGVKSGFDEFFDAFIQPLGETALKSYLVKNYIFVDVVLATAKLVNELGGEVDKVIPEFDSIETVLTNIKTIEQLREQVYKILLSALAFRDSQPNSSICRDDPASQRLY